MPSVVLVGSDLEVRTVLAGMLAEKGITVIATVQAAAGDERSRNAEDSSTEATSLIGVGGDLAGASSKPPSRVSTV